MRTANTKILIALATIALITVGCSGQFDSFEEKPTIDSSLQSTSEGVESNESPDNVSQAFVSLPEPGDPFEMPTTIISMENIDQVAPLARIYSTEIGGSIDVYSGGPKYSSKNTLMGIESDNGIYLIDQNNLSLSHLVHEHSLIAISSTARHLVSTSASSTSVRGWGNHPFNIWDLENRKIVAQLETSPTGESNRLAPYGAWIRYVRFSSDEKYITAFEIDESGDVFNSAIWDVSDGKLLYYGGFQGLMQDSEIQFVFYASLMPGEDTVLVGYRHEDGANKMAIFSFPEGGLIRELPGENVYAVSRFGNVVVYGEEEIKDQTLTGRWNFELLDVSTGNNIKSILYSGSAYYSVSISEQGDLLAIWDSEERTAYIWNLTNNREYQFSVNLDEEFDFNLVDISITPDNKKMVFVAPTGITFVEIATGQMLKTIPAGHIVVGIAMHPTNDILAVQYQNLSVDVYRISTRQLITTLAVSDQYSLYSEISFSSDGGFLFTPNDNIINQIWNVGDWSTIGYEFTLFKPDTINNGQILVASDYYENILSTYSIQGSTTSVLASYPSLTNLLAIKVSPNQQYLAFAGQYRGNNNLLVFNLSGGTEFENAIPALEYSLSTTEEVELAFSPSSQYLMLSSLDEVKVWNMENMQFQSQILNPSEVPLHTNTSVFSPDNNNLFYSGGAANVLTGESVESPVFDEYMTLSPDGKLLITISDGGIITYWGISETPAQTIEQANDDDAYRDSGPFASELTTNIPTPGEVSTNPLDILTNLGLAAFLMLPFAVAVDMFSRIYSSNEENLNKFPPIVLLGGIQKKFANITIGRLNNQQGRDILRLLTVAAFYGLVFSLLEPGWNPISIQGISLFIQMIIAFGLVGLLDDILQWRVIQNWGVAGEFSVRPTNAFLALFSTTISRILTLQPGLMFGSPEAIKIDETTLTLQQKHSLMRISMSTYLCVGLLAWLPTAFIPDFSSDIVSGMKATLLVIFAAALENTFVQLLGLSDGLGKRMKAWNKWVWAATMLGCAFWFLHTLLNAKNSLVDDLQNGNIPLFMEVVVAFIIVTFSTEIFLQYRKWKRQSTQTR